MPCASRSRTRSARLGSELRSNPKPRHEVRIAERGCLGREPKGEGMRRGRYANCLWNPGYLSSCSSGSNLSLEPHILIEEARNFSKAVSGKPRSDTISLRPDKSPPNAHQVLILLSKWKVGVGRSVCRSARQG